MPSPFRWLTPVLLAAAVAGCSGIVRSDSRLSVTDVDGHPLPAGVFQGTIVMVTYMQSTPRFLITDESGEKLSLMAPLEFTTVELENIDAAAKSDPLDGSGGRTSSYSTVLDWTGKFHSADPAAKLARERAVIHAAERGGGHIRGVLGRVPEGDWIVGWGKSKGEWFPAELWIALTHEQAARLAKDEAAAQARAAENRKEMESARAAQESARLQKVAAWRALAVKPPLPDEARKFKLLAEDAVHEKRFQDAAGYYDRALAIDPFWPQGQFNLAVLRGELRQYDQAAEHMRRYLELAPDAKDAQAAGDKIAVWGEKAKLQTRN